MSEHLETNGPFFAFGVSPVFPQLFRVVFQGFPENVDFEKSLSSLDSRFNSNFFQGCSKDRHSPSVPQRLESKANGNEEVDEMKCSGKTSLTSVVLPFHDHSPAQGSCLTLQKRNPTTSLHSSEMASFSPTMFLSLIAYGLNSISFI